MKKIIAVLLLLACAVSLLSSCGEKKEKVVIWTSGEDYRNQYYLDECKKKFPQYEIVLEYNNTSVIATKVIEEKETCSADILVSEEYQYLEKCSDYLAVLSDFDFSPFLPVLVPESKKYTPECKNAGCIILNTKVLADKGLAEPTSYDDLLKPEYKGLVSMPSPKSSSTGYMFLRQLVNEWGEEEALAYFDKLSENILQYTSSGSGPMKALEAREAAVGLGMTAQAIVKINGGNNELKIVYFEEGSPYSVLGNAVLKKSASRTAVMEVFNYLSTELCRGNNEKFIPDQIYKDYIPEVPGFSPDVKYGNMANDTLAEKERLLEKWDH